MSQVEGGTVTDGSGNAVGVGSGGNLGYCGNGPSRNGGGSGNNNIGIPRVPVCGYNTAWCNSIGWDVKDPVTCGYCQCNSGRSYVGGSGGRGGSCQCVTVYTTVTLACGPCAGKTSFSLVCPFFAVGNIPAGRTEGTWSFVRSSCSMGATNVDITGCKGIPPTVEIHFSLFEKVKNAFESILAALRSSFVPDQVFALFSKDNN